MAKSIVDKVADAVVAAEIAIVKSGRQAVAAVNRKVGVAKRKIAGKKKVAKKSTKKAVRKAAKNVRRSVSKTKRAVRKAVKKATKSARRR